MARAGVAGRVDVQLRDYRDVEGRYDAVVSVEMIEAVGMEYWPTFFRTLDRALAPGGRIGIQAILLAHDRMLATRDQYTWINKYVFPGGALPSLRAIDDVVAGTTALRVAETVTFGADYAQTLRAWRERFDVHADGGRRARVRRHVPPHVGLLPRVLRGGVRHRLPRRRPDRALPG